MLVFFIAMVRTEPDNVPQILPGEAAEPDDMQTFVANEASQEYLAKKK